MNIHLHACFDYLVQVLDGFWNTVLKFVLDGSSSKEDQVLFDLVVDLL